MKDREINKIPLSKSHPDLAKEWHPTKNGELTPEKVVAGSGKKVWWKCFKDSTHDWLSSINNRTNGSKCPYCLNKKICKSNSLVTTHPKIASEWHPTKNGNLKPQQVTAGSSKKIWWQCQKVHDHVWLARLAERTQGTNCPYCSNKKVCKSNSLATTHPEIAKEWHPTKNGKLRPEYVTAGSSKDIWWICRIDDKHVWEAPPNNRKNGSKCPYCSGNKVCLSNNVAKKYPTLIYLWHPTKNGALTPNDVTPGSNKKIWWQCPEADDHMWFASVCSMVRSLLKGNKGCPYCRGFKICLSNCLETTHPKLAKEWHPTKNGNLTPKKVYAGSEQKVWWQCSNDVNHIWQARIESRTRRGDGCPFCNSGWTVDRVKLFVKSLLPYIDFMTPAELYVVFQQHGVPNNSSKSKSFLQALKTGKFPKEELEKFVNNKESLVNSFIADHDKQIEARNEFCEEELSNSISELEISQSDEGLPLVATKDVLALLDSKIAANVDKEAIDFFISSAIAKIWRHVFFNEQEALEQLTVYQEDLYSQEVKHKFLEQYQGAVNLNLPKGYNFRLNGKLQLPNLMQRFTAFMVKKSKRFGNWSGTGAGKTLSAILSSRVINSKLTIICCPNSVVDGWKQNIENTYPDSIVKTKDLNISPTSNQCIYIILNYEFFQQSDSECKLKQFVKSNKVDFVVIDEIHYSKQRIVEDVSKRKKVIAAMLSEAGSVNENLHVLGMSATPVINNLFEGKTLIELITGFHHDELMTNPSVANCIALYQKFVSYGLRWLPRYKQCLNIKTIEVNCSPFIEEIKNISLKGSMIDLEAVLTRAKIPEILTNLKPKTIVYTHYLKNILPVLKEAIENNGWRTAVYSGEDKTGLDGFLNADVDILIATSCLGTGLDGLQQVCNRIIINTLPWTHAEFEQLMGRVYRQGQISNQVDIVIPLTYDVISGERWSWCESRWNRIQFKKSLADAAVDGVIPEGHLRTPSQAFQDIMKWLNRLENKGIHEIERRKINISLSDQQQKIGFRKFGDFSKMNHRLNSSSSSVTQQQFSENPEEWEYYHAMYREARKEWPIIPYQEAIKWCKARPHIVIGDFGCGEAFLDKELENKVYSFDHVAINENVIACDMSHVPMDDDSLDAAVFSLSLMGSNYIDYLREARRCLKLDGYLWIAESTSRIKDIKAFRNLLFRLGFDVCKIDEKWKFTFIKAIKSERKVNEIIMKDHNNKYILS